MSNNIIISYFIALGEYETKIVYIFSKYYRNNVLSAHHFGFLIPRNIIIGVGKNNFHDNGSCFLTRFLLHR